MLSFSNAFQSAAEKPVDLLVKIGNAAIEAICSGTIQGASVDAVETLIVGKGPPDDDGKRPPMKVQLAFDLAEDQRFPYRLYNRATRQRLVEVLPREDGGESEVCGYSALSGPRQVRPFPKVRLPILNKDFPIFSMFSDAACNTRYGMTDSAAVPISVMSADEMTDSLAAVLSSDRFDKSWRGVASGRFERRGGKPSEKLDLLVVYPESKPDLDANVVAIFGDDQETLERQFEADSSAVCEALDGIAQSDPASKLNILLFRKISEGQAQMAVVESPTVAEVIAAARRWSEAAANVPDTVIPLPPKEKRQPQIDSRPQTPYPDQVVRLLAQQWFRDGSSAKLASGKRQEPSRPVPGVGLGDVLHLMLRTTGKWVAARDRMLELFLPRLSPLMIGIGNVLIRGQADRGVWDDYPAASRVIALRAVAVAGILLHAHNRLKEVYMTSPAYDIGQFLKLSDILHKDYCVVVRKGSLPPSLIGNATMPAAVDNPRRAVADLNDRMRVYTGWAKTVRDPKGALENNSTLIAVREARKTLRRFEPLAERLAAAGLPERCDTTMKAEMLLGYLAKVQDSQSTEKEQDNE
jgi:hypothetical protein